MVFLLIPCKPELADVLADDEIAERRSFASIVPPLGGNTRPLMRREGQRHERRAGARLAPFLPAAGRIW